MKKLKISKTYLENEYVKKRKTLQEIANQLGTSDTPIKRCLKKYKIPTRNRFDCQLTEDRNYRKKDWLIDEYCLQEKSITQIAKEQNVSRETITNWLRKYGLEIRNIGFYHIGKKNCNFRGYKIRNNGYIMDMVKGHPRGDKSGYIYRHTLIMEKHLKRYLEKGEVIHHKDGDKSNNRLENLQLFPSMREHLKYEGHLNSFAKKLLFSKDCPKKFREKSLLYFKEFIDK